MTTTTPKERPILFKGEMVRAILEGRKTQTRRIFKETPIGKRTYEKSVYPYGKPGERLWVKETWAAWTSTSDIEADEAHGTAQQLAEMGISQGHCSYRADLKMHADRWRPSIHMPRWASRINLEITAIRVERLQDISEADAIAEGIICEGPLNSDKHLFDCHQRDKHGNPFSDCWHTAASKAYRCLWTSINGPDSWALNPFVWVIEFKKL